MNIYKYRKVLCLWSALFCTLYSFSQDTISITESEKVKPTIWQNLKSDALNMYGGIKYAYTRPLHWEKDDFYTLGASVAGTAILFVTDQETSNFIRRQRDDIPQGVSDYGWAMGSPGYNYSITGSVYLLGLVTKQEKIRKTGVLLFSSAVAAGVLQTVTKNVIGRSRPDKERGQYHFTPFSKDAGAHSFPSGHAMLSFTTAYAIGKQFKNPWIKGGIYALGLVTPVSRVWQGAHWLSDVTVGVGLSILIVDSIDHYLKQKDIYKPDKKVSWNLRFGTNTIGVVGTF